jgi:CHAT domain-containing protein
MKLSTWETRLLTMQMQQDQLTLSFERYYPEYYQYKYENRIFSMREIQHRLKDQEALIEYFISDSLLIGFCITRQGIRLERRIMDTPLENYIAHLPNRQEINGLLSNPRELFANYVNSAYALYALLLDPYDALIRGRKLIIIPDGLLGYVSFESLISRAARTDRINYRDLQYVLRDHSISYGYSAALLLKSIDRPKGNPRGELLAFAPAIFDPNAPLAINPSRFAERSGELVNLPQTLQEVAAIGRILRGKVLMEKEATEGRFKALAEGYRILHIATHGLVDNDHPMYSKLAFYPEGTVAEDGYLNTYELFNMKLNAELAVLSACNTGYGKHVKGEGLMTLARGFMYSGVPSLVISLWKVEDHSTAQIMESFYTYLKEGLPKDEALRRAKLDYLETAGSLAASPYFWSSFVNIGDTAPISFRSPWQPVILGTGPAILIFLASLFFLRRRLRGFGILM